MFAKQRVQEEDRVPSLLSVCAVFKIQPDASDAADKGFYSNTNTNTNNNNNK